MLVVCALALVVAAGAFLVIGLAGGDVGDLYLSMVLCLASLVVVAVSARLSKGKPPKAAGEPPTPVAPDGEEEPAAPSALLTAGVVGLGKADLEDDPSASLGERLARVDLAEEAEVDAPEEADIWAKPEGREAPAPVARVAEPTVDVTADEPALDLSGDVVDFPIADYDGLATEQILPLVPRLWAEEVPVVAERERTTKARPAVLDALAEAGGDPDLAFPIAEYDSLHADQVTPLLASLTPDDLRLVRAAERSGQARVGVLVAVADALDALSARH